MRQYEIEDQFNTFFLYFIFLSVIFVSKVLFDVNPNLVDSWERYDLWQAGLSATKNPIVGVGTGDAITVLNSYYNLSGMNIYAEQNYNSHNQYIQIYLSNGIIGLFLILIVVLRPIYIAYLSKDVFGILLFYPFVIYGVTEVFLGRYQGIVFFTFMHQVFVHYYNSMRKSAVLFSDKFV